MVEAPGPGAPAFGYAESVTALRNAAKWVLTASAGVGTLLLAGVQLTGIGQLSLGSPRFGLAVACAGLALMAVAFMIWQASAVLTEEWLTLASFSDEHMAELLSRNGSSYRLRQIRAIAVKIDDAREELFGHVATSLGDLHRRLREQQETLRRSGLPDDERAAAERQVAALRTAARDVTHCANYFLVRDLFSRMRTRLGLAAVIVVLGTGGFAYATSSPESSEPVEVPIVSSAH